MRIAVFSDLHSHDHGDFSFRLPNGLGSRLVDCLDVVDKVGYYYDKYKCDAILFCGDMFHTPSAMPTIVFQETYKRLEKLAAKTHSFTMIAGNHDMASTSKDGVLASTVYALGRLPNTKIVVGNYKSVDLGKSVHVHCLPYVKDSSLMQSMVEEARESIKSSRGIYNILISHSGLDEATNGPNEIKLKGGYSVRKLVKTGADKIFVGHHHHPRSFGKLEVVGSPIQHNMLDRGDRRGMIVYDTKTEKVKRIWFSGSRFFLYEVKSEKDFHRMEKERDSFRNGYVRVMLTKGVISESKIAGLLDGVAKMYRILPVSNLKTDVRNEHITRKALANVGNMSAVLEDYVSHVRPALNRKTLIKIGNRLLSDG